MDPIFERHFDQHPLVCRTQFQLFWERFVLSEAATSLLENPLFIQTAPLVIGCSEFCKRISLQHPEELTQLFLSGAMTRTCSQSYFKKQISFYCDESQDLPQLMPRLRQLRNREMLRIAWRDLAGWATWSDTLYELSILADVIIEYASEKILQWHQQRYGKPLSKEEKETEFFVLALGKLGGKELNFSSDIDLMFMYSKAGQTQGPIVVNNEQFYNGVARDLIKCLNDNTQEGFVYRVDVRLRPHGESGPLVMTQKATENYYQLQGRDWERYAMLKARIIVGQDQDRLKEMIKGFVYRKYVDYSAIESLREMKALLDRETRRLKLQENIKRGSGGIREVEFIVQAFQLIRGGREPHLQTTELMEALKYIRFIEELPKELEKDLRKAYQFLRILENRLQMLDDRQTQELPTAEDERVKLAVAMREPDWDTLYAKLQSHRQKVEMHFKNTIASPKEEQKQAKNFGMLNDLWLRSLKEEDLPEFYPLFKEPQQAVDFYNVLKPLKQSSKIKASSTRGKSRLDSFMPLLLSAVLKQPNPAIILSRIVPIIEAVAKRSAYIVLLMENPYALEHLILYCAQSPWVANKIANFPLLMDEFLISYKSKPKLTLDILTFELQQMLITLPDEDLEGQMEFMREFKHTHEVRAAIYELLGLLSANEVSDYLSMIATVIVEQVYNIALLNLVQRNGYPTDEAGKEISPEFAIVAYGKFGAMELTYESDLDLVFLHGGHAAQMTSGAHAITNGEFYTRLAQRMIHCLNTSTLTGVLYKTDMRLRPSGNMGLLVSQFQAYQEYQLTKAWTWEHQALVRARVIIGSAVLTQKFNALRQYILQQPREEQALREAVAGMRAKMLSHSHASKESDVKKSEGGVIDLEFLIQFAVLRWSHQHTHLTAFTENIMLIQTLMAQQLLSKTEGEALLAAYDAYHQALHQQTLQGIPGYLPPHWQEHRDNILALWKKWVLTSE